MLNRRVPLNQRSLRPGHGNALSGALRATVMVESAISIRLRPRSQLKSDWRERRWFNSGPVNSTAVSWLRAIASSRRDADSSAAFVWAGVGGSAPTSAGGGGAGVLG